MPTKNLISLPEENEFNWELYHMAGIFDAHMQDKIPRAVKKICDGPHNIIAVYGSRSSSIHFLSHYTRNFLDKYPMPCMASISKVYEVWVKSRGAMGDSRSVEIINDLEKAWRLMLYYADSGTSLAMLKSSATFKMWWFDTISNFVMSHRPIVFAIEPEFRNRLKHILPPGILDDPIVKFLEVDADKIYGGR